MTSHSSTGPGRPEPGRPGRPDPAGANRPRREEAATGGEVGLRRFLDARNLDATNRSPSTESAEPSPPASRGPRDARRDEAAAVGAGWDEPTGVVRFNAGRGAPDGQRGPGGRGFGGERGVQRPRRADDARGRENNGDAEWSDSNAEWSDTAAQTEPLRTERGPRQRPRPPRDGGTTPPPPPKRLNPTVVRRVGIALGAVIAVAGLAYVVDVVVSSGDTPRGTRVAGIEVGGLSTDEADSVLRAELDPRVDREIAVRIGDSTTKLVPRQAGLSVDWAGTWARIGGQPLNPVTRLTSLFGTNDVEVSSNVDGAAFEQELTVLSEHDRQTVAGTITFEDGRPVPIAPVPGRVLDLESARIMLIDKWVYGEPLELPEIPAPVSVSAEAIDKALREIAEPAVSAPVTFEGRDGAVATLQPDQIATVLGFAPDGNGGLAAQVNQEAVTGLLAPQLAASEVEPKDASFTVGGGKPQIAESVVGEKVDWPKTLEQLNAMLVGQQRSAPAVYGRVEPKLTTEAANKLGIVEPMGSFTTGGFSGPSGVNIRTVAQKVNGAVIQPGETFSLNGFTGPRGVEQGYVESGIIDHGRPSNAVGGGISQFATTLYNASYFAGLEDDTHTEHSYYISRYPEAREATVFDGAIDLSFKNNTPNGIYIEAVADSSEVTVRLWGTKTVEVESVTGERTKKTEPQEIKLPKGKDCVASEGAEGFTTSDTRIITDRATGREVYRHTRTVKYDPIPNVKCE
ncbi:VanW family protein [Nocardia callitridis]|uniref:VanW family protein n=1 Tax=Nocardia callitridis TaxID=648753 RepID=UPI0031E7BDDD